MDERAISRPQQSTAEETVRVNGSVVSDSGTMYVLREGVKWLPNHTHGEVKRNRQRRTNEARLKITR